MSSFEDLDYPGNWEDQFDDPSLEGPPDNSGHIRREFLDRVKKEILYRNSNLNRIIDIMKTLLSDGPVFEPISTKAGYMVDQLNLSLSCELSGEYRNIPMTALKTKTKSSVNKFLRTHSKFGRLVNDTKESLTDISLREKLDEVMVLHKRMKIIEIVNALNDTYDRDKDDVSDYDEE